MCTIRLRSIRPLLLVLCASTVCLQSFEAPGESGPPLPILSPVWTTGIISDGVGLSHIVVTDLQQDGIPDIVAGSAYAAYVLNPAPGGGYETIWYNEGTRTDWSTTGYKIAVGDRDGDGRQEIFIATDTATVQVYGGLDLHKIATLNLPGNRTANDIWVGDVDHDGVCELVVVLNDAVQVYNANTMVLEWEVSGKGGTGLGVGDIDGDSSLEIVVNGNPAHILNAKTRTEEWGRSGGFGIGMALGDVDGDGIEEIVFVDQGVRVFDADTRTTKWVQETNAYCIGVADVDGDGTSEVLIGGDSLRGLKGTDGTELWVIPNVGLSASGIAAGDVDRDGTCEIVCGARLISTFGEALLIGNWISQSVEWESEDLDGPLRVTSGDIDRDGQIEIVMASLGSDSGYNGGTIHVYDGRTHALEWQTTIDYLGWQVYYVAVGQVDDDPALEIVVAGNSLYDTRIRVYDGISHAMEWESPALSYASGATPAAFSVRNVDRDSRDEIIVGLNNGHVLVFDGATEIFQWDSGGLDGQIQDLDIGDPDGDSLVDLVVLTDSNLYLFKGDNWNRKVQQPLERGKRVSISNADLKGAGELLITTGDFGSDTRLQMWDGETLQPKWQVSLGPVSVEDIVTGNLDGGTDEEFVLIGYGTQPYWYPGGLSLLKICSQTASSFQVKYDNTGYWGAINSLSFADLDQDRRDEAIFGSSFLVQVNEVGGGPSASKDITLSAGGAARSTTVGDSETVQAGYAVLTVNSGTIPYGTAVFSFKQNGVTVSEAGVPASPPTTSARVFIDYRSTAPAVPSRSDAGTVDINTGIAVVNLGSGTANVTYLLRNVMGAILSSGHGTIAAGAHFAKFIDQLEDAASDFDLPSDFQSAIQFGSLEISSDQPLSIVALRMTTNQRNEVLFTTTPTVDLTRSLTSTPVYFPQFADGAGYTTALVLLNTSDGIETGTFQILDDLGAPLVVNQVGGTADSSFKYSIPSGGAFRSQTDGFPTTTKVGWVQLTPDAGTSTPVGAGMFGYNPENVLVTESGIPAAALTTHARVYVDLSGGHNTGLAIANLAETNANISIGAFQSDGTTGIGTSQGPLPLPAKGHSAKFAGEFVTGLPAEFTGVLDIRSATPFAALTMRSLTNERADFLLTTFPIANVNRAAPSPIVFPQIADGGGYVTQFILLSPGGAASTTLNFYGETGAPLAVGK